MLLRLLSPVEKPFLGLTTIFDEDRRMDDVSLLNPEVWVDQYGDALFRFAYQRVGDADIAEDLVQETFLAAMRAKERFKGHSSEKTWLYGILKHKIIDHFRRRKYDRSDKDIEAFAEATDKFFHDNGKWQIQPTSWNINPVEAYEQKEFMDAFYQCLSEIRNGWQMPSYTGKSMDSAPKKFVRFSTLHRPTVGSCFIAQECYCGGALKSIGPGQRYRDGNQ